MNGQITSGHWNVIHLYQNLKYIGNRYGKEEYMSKKIIAVNAGPRKGWNTDTLIMEAARGAESVGAQVEKFDLFRLERYTGCISCFGCKKEKFKGRCICKDGLTPVLDAIREADGLIIGSPNYLGDLTASFRALYERLIFQNLTYAVENPCCNERMIALTFAMVRRLGQYAKGQMQDCPFRIFAGIRLLP